jgi:hypothetical protein
MEFEDNEEDINSNKDGEKKQILLCQAGGQ